MLEVLAHANIGRIPATHLFVVVDVAAEVSVEICPADKLPAGWDTLGSSSSKRFGDQWLKDTRSAILLVPSVVARLDQNALINPMHPEFNLLVASKPTPVIWDKRLFDKIKGK